jgi:hypothetical protein
MAAKQVFVTLIISIVMGFSLISCIGESKHSNPENLTFENLYIEYKGRIFVDGSFYDISRKLYISEHGNLRAVISQIGQVSEMGSYKLSAARTLYEFRQNDSVFSFDSLDSTLIVLAKSDINNDGNQPSPLSASWLLCDWPEDDFLLKSDDSNAKIILGKPCLTFIKNGQQYLIYQGLPLSVTSTGIGANRFEESLHLVADTVFDSANLKMPAGFRRLVPFLSENAGTIDTNSILNFNNQ